MDRNIVIIGAGGHGKVIADIFEKSGRNIIGFIDDDVKKVGKLIINYPVYESLNEVLNQQINFKELDFFIAIGNNVSRKDKYVYSIKSNYKIINAIHPSSNIANNVKILNGNCIMGGTVINPCVSVGTGVIINTGATIDHDCVIEDFAQISPGVNLAGNVLVKELSFIGTGAIVNPGIEIGENAVIGSGTVVIKDIPANSVAVGNPARLI